MARAEPILLIPGLLVTGRLYAEQLPALRRRGPVAIADHGSDDGVAATARPDTPAQTERRRAQMEFARAGRLDEAIAQQLPLLVHRDRLHDEELCATVALMADKTGPEAFVRQQTAIGGRPDSRPDLPAIRCPTLVLVGDHDALTPPELAHEMAADIEGARLVTVPGSGHLTPLERPEQVTDALVQWLQA